VLCVRGPQDAVAELNAMGFPTVDSIDGCCATLAALARLHAARFEPAAKRMAPVERAPMLAAARLNLALGRSASSDQPIATNSQPS